MMNYTATATAQRYAQSAFHEAGHAVIGEYFHLIEGYDILGVDLASIVPGKNSSGGVIYTGDRAMIADKHVDRHVITALAGDLAVKVWAGYEVQVHPDRLYRHVNTTRSVEEIAGRLQHDDDQASGLATGTRHDIEALRQRTERFLGYAPIKAATLTIAERLLERGELTGHDVRALFMMEWRAGNGNRIIARALLGTLLQPEPITR